MHLTHAFQAQKGRHFVYIPDLQEDFIRFLRFVALFEVCK
ncbi:hypothetical protein LEP1GSC120_2690 [Leptospira santarosai str. 200702252]|nr:hypothetical protein LEP1GSC120_2690 [Leptospira santarosai str. 200702252]